MNEESQIPKYESKQSVFAFKIGKIEGLTLFSKDGKLSVTVNQHYLNSYRLNTEGYYIKHDDLFDGYLDAVTFEANYKMVSVGDLDVVEMCESCSGPILEGEEYMTDEGSCHFHSKGECDAWTKEKD